MTKTAFWYHSNDTKRNPWVVLCSQCPVSDSSGCLHITVYLAVYKPLGILQRVTKSQKVHISSHDVLQKLHYIDFAWYRSEVFSDRGWKNRNFFLHPLFFLRTIKNALPGIWELSREKAGFPISRVIVDIPAVIKVFKFY